MLDVTKEIKKILIDKDMTQSDLAEKLGTSQGNIANKLSRNNMKVSEFQTLLDVLGYELKIEKKPSKE